MTLTRQGHREGGNNQPPGQPGLYARCTPSSNPSAMAGREPRGAEQPARHGLGRGRDGPCPRAESPAGPCHCSDLPAREASPSRRPPRGRTGHGGPAPAPSPLANHPRTWRLPSRSRGSAGLQGLTYATRASGTLPRGGGLRGLLGAEGRAHPEWQPVPGPLRRPRHLNG